MIYTTTSKNSLESIKNSIEEKVKKHGFGLLKSYDFKTMLEEKGFPIQQQITVYELCNPAGAQTVLESHPEISVYLPCRISVYEKDGQTVLSTIGLDEIMNTNSALSSEFKEFMSTLFSRLKALMNEWESEL